MARRYAPHLRTRLAKDYGAGDVYTKHQVMAAARRIGLPAAAMPFALAAFLTEDDFRSLAPERAADYRDLKQLFESLPKPDLSWAISGTNMSNLDAVGADSTPPSSP